MTCPITRGCYSVLFKYLFDEKRSLLYEDVRDQFTELASKITSDEPEQTTILLRGFAALDLAYSVLLPSWLMRRTPLSNLVFERNYRGMEELLTTLRAHQRRFRVDSGVLSLTGRPGQQTDLMATTIFLLEHIEEMAQQMKSGLSGRSKLTRVGECLGEIMLKTSTAPERCINHMHTILAITPDYPEKKWTSNTSQG